MQPWDTLKFTITDECVKCIQFNIWISDFSVVVAEICSINVDVGCVGYFQFKEFFFIIIGILFTYLFISVYIHSYFLLSVQFIVRSNCIFGNYDGINIIFLLFSGLFAFSTLPTSWFDSVSCSALHSFLYQPEHELGYVQILIADFG